MSSYKNKEMVKVAYYYYKENLTQGEIANKMLMSRQRVNRLLKRAVEEGIVQIKIVDDEKYNLELENKLEAKFKLNQCVVISSIDDSSTASSLGTAGAEFLEGVLTKDDVVGVTWGKTLSEVARRLQPNEKLKIPVVQLVGGLNIAYTNLRADEITRTLAQKLGGESYNLYAPAIVENKETKDAIMTDDSLKATFEKMEKCSIIVAGIGELNENTTLYESSYLNEQYKEHLLAQGCVGDIGFRWFNKDGSKVEHDYDDRTIGHNILEKKREALVVGIAGGENKYEAILGALRGNYLDVLITDGEMAERLLKA